MENYESLGTIGEGYDFPGLPLMPSQFCFGTDITFQWLYML